MEENQMRTLAQKYINHVNDLEAQKGEHDFRGDRGECWFWDQIEKIPHYDEDEMAAADSAETNSAIGFLDHSVLVWREDLGKWV